MAFRELTDEAMGVPSTPASSPGPDREAPG